MMLIYDETYNNQMDPNLHLCSTGMSSAATVLFFKRVLCSQARRRIDHTTLNHLWVKGAVHYSFVSFVAE